MSYIPKIIPVQLTEDDVTELKILHDQLEQDEFANRGTTRLNDSARQREHLKQCLTRILNQIPRA